jgi:hypothetical protein
MEGRRDRVKLPWSATAEDATPPVVQKFATTVPVITLALKPIAFAN